MDYTTQMITSIAGQVVAVMKETPETGGADQGIREIETQMRDILRQIGVVALGQYLSGLSTTEVAKISCGCGGELMYQRERAASLISGAAMRVVCVARGKRRWIEN
jgi:hypothetical protein